MQPLEEQKVTEISNKHDNSDSNDQLPIEDSSTPTTGTSAADEARAKAQARRQRILEKSRDRMGLVSGDAVVLDTATKASSSMSMRRRRYAGGSKKVASTSSQPLEEAETVNTISENEDLPKSDADSSSTAAFLEERSFAEDTSILPTSAENNEESKLATETSTAPARQYKGVAATRRQMLQREKALQGESSSSKPSSSVSRRIVPMWPLIVHLGTILMLLGAGLWVGGSTYYRGIDDPFRVHRSSLAPREHGIMDRWWTSRKVTKEGDITTIWKQDSNKYEDDEFASKEQAPYTPNLDPLFQVDLDVYTRGDSLFMTIARFAVILHRVNLAIFYFFPLAVLKFIFHIPRQWMRTPPILAVYAVLVRQVAKRGFGAETLASIQSTSKMSGSGVTKDIWSMIKQGVTSFLTTTFPMIVEFYESFTHLRSDMFIILCGVFVGMVWKHHWDWSSSIGEHEEL
jgi:hypothetical protein